MYSRLTFVLPLLLLAFVTPGSTLADHYFVYADGSGDFPTIASACSTVTAGDTILVGDGVYSGPAVSYVPGLSIVIRGLSGDPDSVTLLFRFYLSEGESSPTHDLRIEAITFASEGGIRSGGWASDEDCGGPTFRVRNCVFDDGAVLLGQCVDGFFDSCVFKQRQESAVTTDPYAWATFDDCLFDSNSSTTNGGAILCSQFGRIEATDCVFQNNSASGQGGAIYAWNMSVVLLTRCEFTGNAAGTDGGALFSGYSKCWADSCVMTGNTAARKGGALYVTGGSSVYTSYLKWCSLWGNAAGVDGGGVNYNQNGVKSWVRNTIIAESVSGGGMSVDGTTPSIQCTDIWGNVGGDWVGEIADSLSVGGNFSEDPLFCDPVSGDFHLRPDSPCLNHLSCGQVGALGQSCIVDPTEVQEAESGPIAAGLTIHPNPFVGETTIRFAPSSSSHAVLRVFDVSGRRVAEMNLVGSAGITTWDGKDLLGRRVAPGIYFIQIETAREVHAVKVTLLR